MISFCSPSGVLGTSHMSPPQLQARWCGRQQAVLRARLGVVKRFQVQYDQDSGFLYREVPLWLGPGTPYWASWTLLASGLVFRLSTLWLSKCLRCSHFFLLLHTQSSPGQGRLACPIRPMIKDYCIGRTRVCLYQGPAAP